MHMIKSALMALSVGALALPAAAQEVQPGAQAVRGALLSINAEGVSEAAPDMAVIAAGVTTEGATAAAAMAENARRMNALTQAVRRAGVAERDIQTSNISVNPQYAYAENEPPRVTGYQASNSVNVRVRSVSNVGRVIDAAVGAGGNTINGVSFSHQNPDAQLDAARRDAAANARRRAELYASAFGMRVARVIAISESGAMAPPTPMPVMMRSEAAIANTPVSPGEIETRVNISVTYELS